MISCDRPAIFPQSVRMYVKPVMHRLNRASLIFIIDSMISKKLQWDQQAFVIFYQASFKKKAQNKYDGLHGG